MLVSTPYGRYLRLALNAIIVPRSPAQSKFPPTSQLLPTAAANGALNRPKIMHYQSQQQRQKHTTQKKIKKAIFYCLIAIFFCWSTANLATIAQNTGQGGLNGQEMRNLLDRGNLTEAVTRIEETWKEDYQKYFEQDFDTRGQTAEAISKTLSRLAVQTKKKPALIYAIPRTDQLELILILPDRRPILRSVPEAKQEKLLSVVQELGSEITNPVKLNTTSYLAPAQQLYKWIVAPLETDLQTAKIETLLFCAGAGLRTVPLAAMHDGQQFLIEKYSLARIPAFNLIDINYADLRNVQVLGMGASDFAETANKEPLPAVPLELGAIARQWPGQSFLNEDFTIVNLQSQRLQQKYGIIHLATHAEFRPGTPNNSYIQFWDTQLRLAQMRELKWNNPPLELLVLSACRTALGDKEAELGFAGLALQSGAKSALASLWYVSDAGTLALMTEFYQQLKISTPKDPPIIKAEAMRQAQIAAIEGKVTIEGGQLRSSRGDIPLPPSISKLDSKDLSHPYYWAAFSIIGSPW
ncbi:CHAT domain-containing protein [Microcoleus vaginatus DQ-U2]|uniref:CHAT domain-containing protein n=1 Tax=Microcoleus vaginatus TaxID=119532 RepID=UPI0016888E7E|nr:CHAT domain-containing protein [Microcoleus sp. FACHB-DQ6]